LKLVCDEGVERQVVERLREDGHEVGYIAEDAPSASDEEVLERSADEGAVLVTTDKDFGELVFRLGRVTSGVLLLRLAGLENADKARIASTAVRDHGAELSGAFTVVSPRHIRIRRGPE
jgi:predicted nuclease of predicted toxin-antitoxin system